MKLIAQKVPFSSTVGSSIVLKDSKTGECVALLLISTPNVRFPFKETQVSVADAVTELLKDGVEI